MINYNNINSFTASVIIEEFVRNGVNFFCVSPGSRSTPLAVAVARNEKAESQIFIDERAAAFFALGYARSKNKPAVLICTSGSAVANFLPAIVEADADNIPLIALTADRPPELIECGANQTTKQKNIFSNFVRWEITISPPDVMIPPETVLTTIDFAVNKASNLHKGPVHVNCQFREPLAPIKKEFPSSHYDKLLDWIDSDNTYTRYSKPSLTIDSSETEWICKILSRERKGLVVVGRLPLSEDKRITKLMLDKLGWPVFADTQSGIKCQYSIENFDQSLIADLNDDHNPKTILYLGEQIISKRLLEFIEKKKYSKLIRVKESPERRDPTHSTTNHIQLAVSTFSRLVFSYINEMRPSQYYHAWHAISNSTRSIVEAFFGNYNPNNEASVARDLCAIIPKNHALYIANSMPIRYIDMFGEINPNVAVGSNRGVSGIDGLIASALGFSFATDRPITVFAGDLSIIHDLNSLIRIRDFNQQVIIIVINNNGGGIFSLLPIAKHPDIFDPYFTSPHDLTFVHMAQTFSMDYYNGENFKEQYRQALESGKSALIEVITDRLENAKSLNTLSESIKYGVV